MNDKKNDITKDALKDEIKDEVKDKVKNEVKGFTSPERIEVPVKKVEPEKIKKESKIVIPKIIKKKVPKGYYAKYTGKQKHIWLSPGIGKVIPGKWHKVEKNIADTLKQSTDWVVKEEF